MSRLSTFSTSTEFDKGLYQILSKWAEADPERVYFYGQEGSISYAQVHRVSTRLAKHLVCIGNFSARPILAVSLENAESLFYITWACLASGIGLAFLPPTRNPKQMRLLLDQVGARTLVTDIPNLQESFIIPFMTLAETAFEYSEDVSDKALDMQLDTPAFIFQTSGTTGDPKWVQVSQGQFWSAIQCLQRAGGLRHAIDQVVYITPPLSHSYGMSSLLEYTLVGSAIILPRGSSPLSPVGELLDSVLASSLTAIEGVPDFYSQMARLMRRINLPALRHIGLGGGALNSGVVNEIKDTYPNLSYSIRYGMTEMPSAVSQKVFTPPYEGDWKSSGKVLPIYDLRIVDEADRVLPSFEEGEIQIKGDCVALPYCGEEGGPRDGFFATGDIGYINSDWELCVVGRKSQFLKNRGFRISPEYVEAVISEFEGVRDCRVVMADSGLVAEVVSPDSAFSTQELLNFLQTELPVYMVPEAVILVEAIPRTFSGKIRRC